jgi:hypothetical protein
MVRYILWMIVFVLLLPAAGSSNGASPLSETAGISSGRVLYGNIYGTIRAAETGLPVTGANIRVIDAIAAGATLRDSASGQDGSYLVNAIPITGISRSVTVVIEATGLDPVTVKDAVVLPGALMALQIDMSMTATGSPQVVEGMETSAIVIINQYRHELRKSVAAGPKPKDGERLTSYYYDPLRLTIFATRLGMVGATTANGHVIRAYDHFVALPSLDVLCRKGGYEYEVRVEYDGYAEIVPVWDVGPWNIHDNYWETERYRSIYDYLYNGGHVGGLGQGIPEAEAAFEWNFNSGRDEFERIVTDPSGIDLADGVFWDGLDMHKNDWISVEYLWMDDHHHDDDDVYVNCFINGCSR